MLERLQHPRTNALILGLLQGLPQGLRMDKASPLTAPGFDQNLVLLIAFGLLVPPILAGLNVMTHRGRYPT